MILVLNLGLKSIRAIVFDPDGRKRRVASRPVRSFLKNGGVEQGNYHDYPMVKMAEMPVVETVLVPSYDFWGGVGEPGAPPVTPALLNAMYKATGRRIRNLPIVKDAQPRSA